MTLPFLTTTLVSFHTSSKMADTSFFWVSEHLKLHDICSLINEQNYFQKSFIYKKDATDIHSMVLANAVIYLVNDIQN